MRGIINLDGLWRFQPDLFCEGVEAGWHLAEYDDRHWLDGPVPGCFDAAMDALDHYQGACWYRRTVDVPASWAQRRRILRFEGLNNRGEVWIDGQPAGASRDGFLRVDFDLGGDAPPGAKQQHHCPGCQRRARRGRARMRTRLAQLRRHSA